MTEFKIRRDITILKDGKAVENTWQKLSSLAQFPISEIQYTFDVGKQFEILRNILKKEGWGEAKKLAQQGDGTIQEKDDIKIRVYSTGSVTIQAGSPVQYKTLLKQGELFTEDNIKQFLFR
ncbi:hypothetical protein [Streptococcus merionis]|uniref:hypothetical protein n=1 Tax=Streptococcus merionis TaxID=400065 RepID=UPI0035140B12